MLLHIGADVSIPLDKIIFVLNERSMTPPTRTYIEKAKRERRLTPCAGKVKSYIVLRERGKEKIFASHIASATLEKRWRSEIGREYLNDVAVLTISEIEE
ncbi:MAG: extracellular matrix/biofilm biosynthesis regulator RemA family protein [Clostridiaceae bacterium]|nr:extracellular matrix/biofilm biosynthesis regulator RemA family protein [Feifaniaceae bacterium]